MRIEKFLADSPAIGIHLAYERVVGELQRRLALEGVHLVQALILTGLFFENRAVRPSELARSLSVGRANISHALRGLEKQGWIERRMHGEDARGYWLDLTRAGRKKAPRLIKIFDQHQSELEKVGGAPLNLELRRFLNAE